MFGLGKGKKEDKKATVSKKSSSEPKKKVELKQINDAEFGAKPKKKSSTAVGKAKTTAAVKSGTQNSSASFATVSNSRIRGLEANETQVKELLAYSGDLVTGSTDEAEIKVSENQKKVIVIMADGTVVIAKGDPLNPHLVSVKSLAKKNGVRIRRELSADLEVIRKIYENAEKREGGAERVNDAAKMQRDFIELVRAAGEERASDIHILLERFEAVVKIRSDGVMKMFRQLPADYTADLLAAAFAMADASDPSYKPYDYQGARISETSASLPTGIQAVRLQFNPLPNGGRYLIARILYAQASESGVDIDRLGYSDVHIRDIKTMRRKPFGINIISGPTGSGKSTTLQVALTALMEEKRFQTNVLTIEDPPEYVIKGAAQLPVTNATTDEERNEKFRQAIAAALRSDPDIIMIGEIRDASSTALAFAAAMTGHQVWASLHSNDAISILDRFRDQGVELYKLCDHTLMTGLVGQRLLRVVCKHCSVPLEEALVKTPELFDDDTVKGLHDNVGKQHFHRISTANPDGCPECKKGYAGRTVVAECINPDAGFMKHILDNDKSKAYDYWLDHLEGLSMIEHAVQKMLEGIADPRDVEDRVSPLFDFLPERKAHVLKLIGIEDNKSST